jgi:proteasome lid subunit RPN8/RPN11
MLGNNLKNAEWHALEFPDREVCGFVYKSEYIPLTNIAKDPRSFIADPREVALVLARYGEPLAIFHSHPNGNLNPSEEDIQLASYYNNSMIIIGVIVSGKLELSQVVAPPQLDPEPAVHP